MTLAQSLQTFTRYPQAMVVGRLTHSDAEFLGKMDLDVNPWGDIREKFNDVRFTRLKASHVSYSSSSYKIEGVPCFILK